MALSVRVTGVRKVAATGHVYIEWADGPESEFDSLAAAIAWAQDMDLDSGQARDLLRKMAIRYYLVRDPAATNPTVIVGKTMTLDLSSATPLVVV